ncbi:hypothetical protein DFH28DRAFT_1097893 [Melampsora americana]|nr:hypothetical protein DFH28DRAFT_1097893 [Melampsora americana]
MNPFNNTQTDLLDTPFSEFLQFSDEGQGAGGSLTTDQQSNVLHTTDHTTSDTAFINQSQFNDTEFQASSNFATGTANQGPTLDKQQFEQNNFGFPAFDEAHPNLSSSYTNQPISSSHGGTDFQAGSQLAAGSAPLDPQIFGTQASTSGIPSNQASMSGSGSQFLQMPPPPPMTRSSSSHLGTAFPTNYQFSGNPTQSTSQTYPPQASTSRLPSNDPSTGMSGRDGYELRSNTNQSNAIPPVPSELRGVTPLPNPSGQLSIHAEIRVATEQYLAEKRAVEVKISRTLFDIIKRHGASPDVVNQILNDLRQLLVGGNPSQPQPAQPSYTAPADENARPNKKRKAIMHREASTTGSQTSETATTKPKRPYRSGIPNPVINGAVKKGRPPKVHTENAMKQKAAENPASQSHNPEAGPSNQPAN